MMMCLVLILTASTAQADDNAICLHEWGVVIYDGNTARAVGGPGSILFARDEVPIEAEAPVINIYGPEFTGDVTVAALGAICEMYPEPDAAGGPGMMPGGLGSFIRWAGLRASSGDECEESLQEYSAQPVPAFAYAVPSWRPADALTLERADGFSDRFLYYEVDVTGTGFPLPLAGHAAENEPVAREIIVLHGNSQGVAVTFELLHGGDPSMAGTTAPHLYSGAEVRQILAGWASGTLTDHEIDAMWATWEPYILSDGWAGESLMIFPLPGEVVDRISSINVENDQGFPVTVQRFFLGMMYLP